MELVSKPNAGGGKDYTSVTNKEARRLVSSGSAEWNFRDKAFEEERRKNQMTKEAQAGADFRYNMALEAQNKQIIQNSIDMEARRTQPNSLGLGPLRSSLPQGPQSSQLSSAQMQQYGLLQAPKPVQAVDPRTGRVYGTVRSLTSAEQSKMRQSTFMEPTRNFFSGIFGSEKTPETQSGKETYMAGAAVALALPFDEIVKGGRAVKAGAVPIIKRGKTLWSGINSRWYGRTAVTGAKIAATGVAVKEGSEGLTYAQATREERQAVKFNEQIYKESKKEAREYALSGLSPGKRLAYDLAPSIVVEKTGLINTDESFRKGFQDAMGKRGVKNELLLSYAERERSNKQWGELVGFIGIEAETELGARALGKTGMKAAKATENILKRGSQETVEQFQKRVGKEAFKRQLPAVASMSAVEGASQYAFNQYLYDEKVSPTALGISAAGGGVLGIGAQRFITVPSFNPKTRWQSKTARGIVEVFETGQEFAGDKVADVRQSIARGVTRQADIQPTVTFGKGFKTAKFDVAPVKPRSPSFSFFSSKPKGAASSGAMPTLPQLNIRAPPGRAMSPEPAFRFPANPFKPSPGPSTPPTTPSSSPSSPSTSNNIFNINQRAPVSSSTASNAFSSALSSNVNIPSVQFAPRIPPPVPIGLPGFKGGTQGKQAKRYVDELSMAFGKLQNDLSFGGGKRQKMSSFEIGKSAKNAGKSKKSGTSKPRRWLF